MKDDDTDTLKRLEESLWRAKTRFDRAYCELVFADEFFEFGRSGRRYTRNEQIFKESDRAPINALTPLPEFKIHEVSDNIALVTYISEVTDGAETLRANRSSLWRKEDKKGWRLVFHQGTPTT